MYINLKPCPFCGGVPVDDFVYDECGEEAFFIYCGNEECEMSPQTLFYPTLQNAIDAWNRRADDEQD